MPVVGIRTKIGLVCSQDAYLGCILLRAGFASDRIKTAVMYWVGGIFEKAEIAVATGRRAFGGNQTEGAFS